MSTIILVMMSIVYVSENQRLGSSFCDGGSWFLSFLTHHLLASESSVEMFAFHLEIETPVLMKKVRGCFLKGSLYTT